MHVTKSSRETRTNVKVPIIRGRNVSLHHCHLYLDPFLSEIFS